jgi:hypothetical protein
MSDGWIKAEPEDSTMHDWESANELEGVFEKFEEGIGANESRMYTIRKENGEVVKTWGTTVLDSRMEMVPLKATIKIVYKGYTKSPKTGREYKDFDVFYQGSSK